MASATDTHTVSLTMPAKPEYLVLARLALSAVCRLTPLEPEQVADLKLAITESATYIMGGERRSQVAHCSSSRSCGAPWSALCMSLVALKNSSRP